MIDLAKLAYEAWAKATGGDRWEMPAWESLDRDNRNAWDAAAQAVAHALNDDGDLGVEL